MTVNKENKSQIVINRIIRSWKQESANYILRAKSNYFVASLVSFSGPYPWSQTYY